MLLSATAQRLNSGHSPLFYVAIITAALVIFAIGRWEWNNGNVSRFLQNHEEKRQERAQQIVQVSPGQIIPVSPGRRRRSSAWIYYSVLSCASLAILFTGQVVGLAGFIICGGYALYLYRGGRFVIWFW